MTPKPKLPELVSEVMAARAAGVTRVNLRTLQREGRFPAPAARYKSWPLWRVDDLRVFLAQRREDALEFARKLSGDP